MSNIPRLKGSAARSKNGQKGNVRFWHKADIGFARHMSAFFDPKRTSDNSWAGVEAKVRIDGSLIDSYSEKRAAPNRAAPSVLLIINRDSSR